MNRLLSLPLAALLSLSLFAQSQPADNKTPQETARTFTRQGDYSNAIVVLNSALKSSPDNLELLKDLAFNYYLNRDYTKGEAIAKMKDSRGNEIGHSVAERTTFVVAPNGKIIATIGGVAGDANAEQALAVVQQLAEKRTAKN